MTDKMEAMELKDRLSLIETMIAEGRRTTESWGWTFVLWGVAYYVAIAWASLGHSTWAWPVTMVAASVITGIYASRIDGRRPETTIGRAMIVDLGGHGHFPVRCHVVAGVNGRLDGHSSIAIVGAMLGAANATSSFILRWRMQFACAVVWWSTAVAACFVTEMQAGIVFLVAIFFCQIVFGIYGMLAEARERKQGASHA